MNSEVGENTLITQLFVAVMELQGMLKASNIVQHSLLSVVCENSPQLIEQIRQKITDVSELSLTLNEFSSEIASTAFSNEIHQSILRFSLIEDASTYSPTFIEVKEKT